MTKKTQMLIGGILGLFTISSTISNWHILPREVNELKEIVSKDHDELISIKSEVMNLNRRLDRQGLIKLNHENIKTNLKTSVVTGRVNF